ncbi:ABC-type glycerol-3-phosphate transport system, substrate-binding protein [Pilibacter termitis]|uniref:ABC-type glycerol-3-phosphate transport system, substrate-binding protein n=1 Tax=Pilibacter termitis TaxID=263852 RepID=A0A1T4QXJ0_9ENTE|nr:extracellular solute-binding protein [Pilibacter termitis]SKA08376.1 ABC-type glycerol-3-phosphate transport system, substrate-binding protein [Pilibacter termitis]
MKRISALFLCFLAIFALTACGKEKESTKKVERSNEPETSKLDYQESAVALPEGVASVADVALGEEGTLFLVGGDKEKTQLAYWKSKDNGKNWEKVADFTEEIKKANGKVNAQLSTDGTGIFSLEPLEEKEHSDEHQVSYFFFNKEATLSKMNETLQATLDKERAFSIEKLGEEKLFLTSEKGALLLDIKTGKTTNILSNKAAIFSMEESGGFLYLLTSEKPEKFSLATGKSEEKEVSFAKLAYLLQKGKNYYNQAFGILPTNNKVMIGVGKNNIYRVTGEKEEILLNKSKTLLGDSSNFVRKLLPYEENAFLVLINNEKGDQLLRYEAKGEKKEEKNSAKKLKVYILEEDFIERKQAIHQAINLYQRKHEDVEIEVEIGSENGEISTDDALKNLNAKLASGDAPDILVLDGLNVQKYQKQGIFADISEIVEKNKNETNLNNILSTYEKNGKYYGLPLTFATFGLYGPDTAVQGMDSMEDLTKSLSSLAKKNKETIFENWMFDELATITYRAYFVSKEKELTEKELKSYYTNMKKLYDLVDMKEVMATKKLKDMWTTPVGISNVDAVTVNDVQVSLDYVDNPYEVKSYELADKVKKYPLTFFKDEKNAYFVPRNSLSVLNASKNKELAKDFLDFAISQEAQNGIDTTSGFPVNKQVLAQSIKAIKCDGVEEVRTEFGGSVKVELKELDDTVANKWLERFDKLNTPNTMDVVLFKIITKNMDAIMKGEISIQDGTKQTMRRVKLYQSE